MRESGGGSAVSIASSAFTFALSRARRFAGRTHGVHVKRANLRQKSRARHMNTHAGECDFSRASSYGDNWEAAFRQKYETEMREKFDTHFYVGTINQHPKEWIIVGLFYPPKDGHKQADSMSLPFSD